MSDEYMTFVLHEDSQWRWTVWSSEQDKLVAAGHADTEALADEAADSVTRLMESK